MLRVAAFGDPLAVLEQVARLTVAIAVTSIAVRLPPSSYRRHGRSLATMLGPVIPATSL